MKILVTTGQEERLFKSKTDDYDISNRSNHLSKQLISIEFETLSQNSYNNILQSSQLYTKLNKNKTSKSLD